MNPNVVFYIKRKAWNPRNTMTTSSFCLPFHHSSSLSSLCVFYIPLKMEILYPSRETEEKNYVYIPFQLFIFFIHLLVFSDFSPACISIPLQNHAQIECWMSSNFIISLSLPLSFAVLTFNMFFTIHHDESKWKIVISSPLHSKVWQIWQVTHNIDKATNIPWK